mgnify:FL=1
MRAMVHHRFGAASEVLRLEEVETPVPGPGQLLVRVRASSANPYDWHFIRAQPWFMRLGPSGLRTPKAPVPGADFAGVVEAVGSGDAGGYAVGDEVFGLQHGAYAEYVVAKPERMGRKPAGISWEEAASLPMAAVTAMQGLKDDGGVEAGQKVLIIGASGGIGILAVQMAKAWGAEVTGVCSTPNTDLVLAHGADRVIDYKREDFTRSDERFDFAFQLGGTESARTIRRVLAEGGTIALCAGDGNRVSGPVLNIAYGMLLGRFVSQRIVLTNPQGYADKLELIRQMVESGELRPVVDHAVDFEDAGFAIDEVETGSPRGKIAIRGVA